MMRGKTLLLLGGSFQQCVAIEKAKALGIRTVLCDYLTDNPGQRLANKFYLQSTTDREGVLSVARQEKVNGVLAYASDPAAPTAAYVAEQLGLPTNPLQSVEILSLKNRFREHLAAIGLPCPKAVSFSAAMSTAEVATQLKDLSLPFVMKPTDSSGSKGVTIIHQPEDIPAALQSARRFSRNGVLIAETYIEKAFPYGIGGDIFVLDGTIVFDGLMYCIRDPKSDLIPGGEVYPSGLSPTQKEVIRVALTTLVRSLNIQFGEFNVEVLLGKDDTPYIMELGARAGGNFIPLQLSDLSGIDLVEANVLCAVGERPTKIAFSGKEACFATYVIHSDEAGIFQNLVLSEIVSGRIYRRVMYRQIGEAVEAFTGGANQALGVLFLKFETQGEMKSILDHIGDHIQVIVG